MAVAREASSSSPPRSASCPESLAAIPIAAGALEPAAFTLSPEIAALGMSGSSIIVALNVILLRRLHLPDQPHQPTASRNPAPQT